MSKKLTPPVSTFFPSDWPIEGPIDLKIHDLPHISSTTEWWYMHSHIKAGERNFSVFASFFKSAFGYDKKTKKAEYGYSVIWSISEDRKSTRLNSSHRH